MPADILREFMRNLYLHSLTLFGLGAAIALVSADSSRAAEPGSADVVARAISAVSEPAKPPMFAAVDGQTDRQPLPSSNWQAKPLAVPNAALSVTPPSFAQGLPPAEMPSEEAPSAPLDETEADSTEPADPADEIGDPISDSDPIEDSAPIEDSIPLEETPIPETAPLSDDPSAAETGLSPIPEYLQPSGNPLLVPTQPEEVEILGTQPLGLETAIELAYRNNQDLQVALLELERSQAALREARAALYPTLDGTAQVQANNSASASSSSSPFFGNADTTTTTATAGLDLTYDLGLSGGRRARIRAAEEAVRSSELEVERVQAQLRLDTVNDYYDIQEATAQIAINQAFLEEAERNLNDTILREEVGVGTRFDVLRSQVQVANARQNVISARSQLRTSQRQLAARLNVPPSINVDTLPVEIAGTWPLSLEESIVLAYQGRAELEQLLVQRQIAQAQRQIALSAVRPEVALFANYNVIQGFSTNLSDFDDGFSLGAQLQWRLFDGGAAAAAATQSARDADIAESNFSRTLNDVRFQVEQAYFNLEASQENIDTARLAVTQAEEAVDLANLRFNAGVGTQLDVLTATSELADARGNLITAILTYNRALATLERSVSNIELDPANIP